MVVFFCKKNIHTSNHHLQTYSYKHKFMHIHSTNQYNPILNQLMILLFFSAFISELNALYISYKYFWSKWIVIKDSILNQLWWYKRYFLPFKYFLQFALISASYKTPWRPLMKMKAPSLGSELSSASSTSSSSSSFRSSSSTSSSPWSSSPSTSLARRSLRTTWTRTRSLASTLLLGQSKGRSPQVLIPFLTELLKCKIKLTL